MGDVRTTSGPEASAERGSAQPIDAKPLRDSADIAGGPEQGESPGERLDSFADKVNERLSGLADETGTDLSQVQGDFAGYVQRLQDGISDGSLGGADLERGVRNALAMTAGTVQSALAPGQAPGGQSAGMPSELGKPVQVGETGDVAQGQSPGERLEGFEAMVNERIGSLAEGADEQTISSLRGAQQSFAMKLDELRSGLEDGSMDAASIGQGVQAALSSLGQNIQDAVAPGTQSEGTRSNQFGPGSADGGASLAGANLADDVNPGPTGPAAADAQGIVGGDDHGGDGDHDGGDVAVEGDVAGRLDAFASTLADRLAGLERSGMGSDNLQEAGADLMSMIDRLSSAVSDGGVTGDHAASLFQRALSGFSDELGGMFGKLDNQMNLYGRDAQRADTAG